MDFAASLLTILCVLGQFFVRWKLAQQTTGPLREQRDRITNDTKRIAVAPTASELRHDVLCNEVRMALEAAYPVASHHIQEPIAAAFNAEDLLPANYNSRLDAAVPGIFTAIGICAIFF